MITRFLPDKCFARPSYTPLPRTRARGDLDRPPVKAHRKQKELNMEQRCWRSALCLDHGRKRGSGPNKDQDGGGGGGHGEPLLRSHPWLAPPLLLRHRRPHRLRVQPRQRLRPLLSSSQEVRVSKDVVFVDFDPVQSFQAIRKQIFGSDDASANPLPCMISSNRPPPWASAWRASKYLVVFAGLFW